MAENTRSDAHHDGWSVGRSYDEYMGRWSRAVAACLLDRLDLPAGLDWLDVGCGTGALSAAVIDRCEPRSVLGVDPSDGFVRHAAQQVTDRRARFDVGAGADLPCGRASIDVVTSALAYNFMPDRVAGLVEFQRVARPNATIAFYVWDYPGGGVGFIDVFWKAAIELDSDASRLDEAVRFPFCTADGLAREVAASGCREVTVEAIEVATTFVDFDAFWRPFTLGAGPAPGYVDGLTPVRRGELRQLLADRLGDGPIERSARAWAVTARPGRS